jgi:hypothetical protein
MSSVLTKHKQRIISVLLLIIPKKLLLDVRFISCQENKKQYDKLFQKVHQEVNLSIENFLREVGRNERKYRHENEHVNYLDLKWPFVYTMTTMSLFYGCYKWLYSS